MLRKAERARHYIETAVIVSTAPVKISSGHPPHRTIYGDVVFAYTTLQCPPSRNVGCGRHNNGGAGGPLRDGLLLLSAENGRRICGVGDNGSGIGGGGVKSGTPVKSGALRGRWRRN